MASDAVKVFPQSPKSEKPLDSSGFAKVNPRGNPPQNP
jgi:hypothetical protein